MVRNYKKKDSKRKYSNELLARAVELVENGRPARAVARELKIEKMFLCRLMKRKRSSNSEHEKLKVGRGTALSVGEEQKLADHLRIMAKWGFALGKKEVQYVVKEYVEQNALTVPFKSGLPGSDWFRGFCKRNHLSLKNLEPLEKSRKYATGDPFIIYGFYDLLEKEVKALDLSDKPKQIFNLDETSFCSDPSRVKCISGIGQKAHRQIEGSGRDNTTVLACCSADGEVYPPLIIFQASNLWSTWKGSNDLPGTYYASSENGWMTSVIFQEWFVKFCETIKERPILMILDGHLTHLDMGTISYAVEQNVTVIKLPAHTTDILQPLDKCCFKTLKYEWDLKLLEWFRQNQRRLQKNEFVDLLCEVWHNGLKSENVKSGFRSTGIYPVDRQKYPISRFEPEKHSRYLAYLSQRRVDSETSTPSSSTLVSGSIFSQDTSTLPIPSTSHQDPATSMLAIPSTSNQDPELLKKSFDKAENVQEDLTKKTFEELLLQRIRRSEPTKMSRKKIDGKAKVITSEEYVDKIKNTQTKKTKTIPKQDDEDESDEDVPLDQLVDDDSVKDLDLCEPLFDEFVELEEPTSVKIGDFLLVKFKGGKRKSTLYRYAVTVINVLDDDDIEVMGLKAEQDKKTFKKMENDISVIKRFDIIGKLPVPNIVTFGDRYKYVFENVIDIFQV